MICSRQRYDCAPIKSARRVTRAQDSFLRAINSGHPGSFSRIHASSPSGALEQLVLMVLQSGLGLGRDDTLAYVRSMIDVIVQLGRTDGRRDIMAIEQVGLVSRART